MIVKLPESAYRLAEIFGKNKKTLYVVGGVVRAAYMGVQTHGQDIDICSAVTLKEIERMLKNTEFSLNIKSETLGVVEIECAGQQYTHATFRKESYALPGVHVPEHVEFVKTIEEDADRRDFTINAIYVDILSGEVADPFGGIADLKNKLVKAVTVPDIVLKNDGVRILRMVRIACTLGLEIDPATFASAQKNIQKLGLISKQWIKTEFSRIIQADIEYPTLNTRYAHFRGLDMLTELGAWKYMIPAFGALVSSKITLNSGISLINFTKSVVFFSNPEIRLSSMMSQIGRLVTQNKNEYQKFSASLSREALGSSGMGFDEIIIKRVEKILSNQDYGQGKFFLKKSDLRRFIYENQDVIEYIIMLMHAKSKALSSGKKISRTGAVLKKTLKQMQKDGTPFSIKDLAVSGADLRSAFPNIADFKIKKILSWLLDYSICHPNVNNKAWLLKKAQTILERL